MKYLIMTEGTCEKAFVDVLVEKELLFVPEDMLLYEQIFHARQIKTSLVEMINQLPPQQKVVIIRIGDKLSDELIIPDELKDRIVECLKICIKPEFEILHLISRNEERKYLRKHKSSVKASTYLHNIDCKYEKSYEYNYSFFSNISQNDLLSLIRKYTKLRKNVHKSDELVLEYIIKKEE